jgi:DNA polymerase elongation subunit (family B)
MRVINVFYEANENKQIIINVVKQVNGKKVLEKIPSSFLPYFYTQQPISSPLIKETHTVNAINGIFLKHVVQLPQDVKTIRDTIKAKTFEADIPFAKRWLIDTNLDCGDEPLTCLAIDIEANNPPERWVDFDKDEILSIACYNDSVQKVFFKDDFKDEKELLMNFFDFIKDYSVIFGWNLKGFDLPYLRKRLIINGLGVRCLKFFCWLDLMDLYKRFVTSYSKTTLTTSYALESVAKLELGEEKYEKREVMLTKTKEAVAKYNLRDAELCWKLEKKLKLIKLIEAFSQISNLPIVDCEHFSRIITFMVMRELKGKWVFNNTGEWEKEGYKGGYVFEAPVGIFENVAVFDFKSLYPNIIRSFNISIETLSKEGRIKIPNNCNFKTEKGVYPKLIEKFMELRKQYKQLYEQTNDEIYNTLQIGCKFLNASFYGVLGFGFSRIYNKQLAESITSVGRYLLQNFLPQILEEKGYKILAGDTDSIFIQLKTQNFLEEIQELEKLMNEKLKLLSTKFNLTNNYLDIRCEKIFKKVLFYGRKKRYFGLICWEDGKWCNEFFARGLEIRRTDWCQLAVEYEAKLLELLLQSVNEAYKFHKEFVKNIFFQPTEKFVIYKSLTKNPSEYKVKPLHAMLATEKDFVGDKIGYLVVGEGERLQAERWEGKDVKICYNYYIDRQIYPIYERLLLPFLQSSLKGFCH